MRCANGFLHSPPTNASKNNPAAQRLPSTSTTDIASSSRRLPSTWIRSATQAVISLPSRWRRGRRRPRDVAAHLPHTPYARCASSRYAVQLRDCAPRRASARGARRHDDRLQRCSACSRGDSASRAAAGVGAGPHGWAGDHGGGSVDVEVDARVAGAVGAGEGD